MFEVISQLTVNSLISGSIYALVAVGFSVIYGATKFFNLAHGAIAAIGGYATFVFVGQFGISTVPAVVLGVLFAGFVGWLSEKIIYLPLRKRKASNMALLVASLGVFTMMQAALAILFSTQPHAITPHSNQKIFEVVGATLTSVQASIILMAVLSTTSLILLLKYTAFGRTVRAVSDDAEVATIVGIDANKVIGRVFFLGSAFAGLAGILVGLNTAIKPGMGFLLLLKGVVGAIIGGIHSIYGAVLGSFLLGFAENFGVWFVSGEWKDAIAFILLLLFLLFRPGGIINK